MIKYRDFHSISIGPYSTSETITRGFVLLMPRIKSSIKDVRRTKSRRARNRAGMSTLKTAIRRVRTSAEDKRAEELKSAYHVIDKASQNGLIHRNAGARYKSRLSKFSAKPAVAAK